MSTEKPESADDVLSAHFADAQRRAHAGIVTAARVNQKTVELLCRVCNDALLLPCDDDLHRELCSLRNACDNVLRNLDRLIELLETQDNEHDTAN